MAVALTVTPVTRAGVEQALVAANAAGHVFLNPDDRTVFVVNNASASPVVYTLAFNTGVATDGSTPPNKTVSVPANKIFMIGPFPTQWYNDANGSVTVTPATTTSQSVGAFRLAS